MIKRKRIKTVLTLAVMAVSAIAPFASADVGQALYERWTGAGTADSMLTETSTPDYTEFVTSAQWGYGDDDSLSSYRSRITGWLTPPVTGNYTFWITTDDNGRLWLSTDHTPDNATLVASVPGWAGQDDWTKFTEQQSANISLQAGHAYWFRGGHQEGGGGDHIRIAWASSEAGIADYTIIEGQYLSDTKPGAYDPSPADGGFVHPGSVDLEWTNANPTSGDEVRVELWFGKDPNLIQITDPNLSETINMTTKTVNAPAVGTYAWRVNSYLDGVVHAESKVIGPLWSFIAKEDLPPVVDAGVDMITWQNQAVTLDPIIDDDEVSTLTYYWTAPSEPDVVVVFDSNSIETPTVTITVTKPFNNPFVGNPGFEDPVLADGAEWEWDTSVWVEADYSLWEYIWYYVDEDYTSTYNPSIAADGFEAPEGENVGCVYTYPGYDYALTQILAETLQESTRYDLSVQVGNSGPYNEYVSLDYRVELWTGGNVGDHSFLYGSGEQTIDPNDGWETVNLTYACGPNHEQLGEPLEIRLIAESYADGHAVYFDDVILSIDGKSGTFPPHHSVDLTLAVHDEDNPTPVEDTMTIDVYADACMAAISAGAGDPGDVDEDCDTDLEDIAKIAAAWLDVYSLTAPFEKL